MMYVVDVLLCRGVVKKYFFWTDKFVFVINNLIMHFSKNVALIKNLLTTLTNKINKLKHLTQKSPLILMLKSPTRDEMPSISIAHNHVVHSMQRFSLVFIIRVIKKEVYSRESEAMTHIKLIFILNNRNGAYFAWQPAAVAATRLVCRVFRDKFVYIFFNPILFFYFISIWLFNYGVRWLKK